jgi:hypothetical protein
MRGHLPRRLLTLVLVTPAFALGGALAVAQKSPSSQTGRGALPPSRITRTSRPMRLIRSWEEPDKSEAGEQPRRVDVFVDYSSGEAWERFTSAFGEPLGRMAIAIGSPRPSPEEIAEAFQLARKSPELALTFKRYPSLVLEGGFILQEPQGSPCGPQTRCLHVFLLSPDRAGLIRRIVVDLSHLRLAYKTYTPPSGRFE